MSFLYFWPIAMPDDLKQSPQNWFVGLRLGSWIWRLVLVGVDYLKTYHFGKYLAPYDLVTRVWKMGWALRFVLCALFVGAVGTGLGLDWQRAGPDATAKLLLEFLEVAFFALAWSVASAAATMLPTWGFALMTAWLCQTSILSLGAVKFTPLMVMPTWWLVIIGWRLCVTDDRRWRGLLTWLVLAAGAGYATAGPSGFRQMLGISRVSGQLLAGCGYALIGCALWWKGRSASRVRPGFADTLAVSVPLLTGLLAVAWWRDRAMTVSWMPDLFGYVDAVVFLFWLWSGGEAFLSSWKMIDWSFARLARLKLARLLVWLLPVVWVVALVAEFCVGYGTEIVNVLAGLPATILVRIAPALRAMIHAPVSLWFTCQHHVWVTAAVLIIAFVQWRRGKLSVHYWIAAGGIWIVSFMGLFAYVASRLAIVKIAQGTGNHVGNWTFTVGALALLLSLAGVQKDWRTLRESLVRAQLGWMTAAIAIVLTARIAKGAAAEAEQLLFLYLGMVYFGLARVLYSRLSHRASGSARISLFHQMIAALVGIVCGWAGLMFGPTGTLALWLPLVPLALWLIVLLVMRKLASDWDRLAGAMAGALLGAGTLFYTLTPFPVNVPFVSPTLSTPAVISEKRPPLGEGEQLGLVLVYTLTAGGLGLVVFRRRATFPPMSVTDHAVAG